MKKVLLSGFASALLLASCATVQNGKVAQNQRVDYLKLKGDWQVTNVDYPAGYKVQTLDENADAQCWVGSVWHLVPNNYTGSYTMNGSSTCPSVTQPFKFEVLGGNEFRFKKLTADLKPKNVTQGYSMTFMNQTDSSFQLQQNAPVDGKLIPITYTFQKITK